MKRPPTPDQADDDRWAVARAREAVLRRLIQQAERSGPSIELASAAAEELAISRGYLYRLLRVYRADSRTRSLLPRRPGPSPGGRHLDPHVEAIVADEIQNNYLQQLRPSKAKLTRDIQARCHAAALPAPDRETVTRRLASISRRESTRRRHGPKAAADAFDPVLGECRAERPLELLQIDHTPADVIAVEPETLEPIGRPFITLAIDVCSRMYAGFHLTFDPPSATSVACCLLHAVMDKGAWLENRGLPAAWPVAGLPETIHVDNGKEFHSRAFTRACEDYGIAVRHRPVRRPHFGGHVERRLGHLSQELHLLDGSTFSNIQERGAYDAEGNACLTITEIEWMVASIILEHNASFHSGIATAPIARWRELTAGATLRLPSDLREFHYDFLPWQERTVQRDGIHLFGIRYWHDALLPLLHDHRKVVVHYDPANLAQVHVRGTAGGYLQVAYRNLRRPAISLWEHRAAVRALRRQGRAGVDEAMVFDMILARRKALEEVRGRSRKARLALARSGARPARDPLLPAIGGSASDGDVDEDAPLLLPYYEADPGDG